MASFNGNSSESPRKASAGFWRDCVLALWFLAQARIAHLSFAAADVEARNRASAARGGNAGPSDEAAAARRVGWLITRMAARVPWRSDCLVQAIAAQKWLNHKGISTSLIIGVDKDTATGFAAHAWLRHGDLVVTGGNTDRYTVLLDGGGAHGEASE